jgi:hypothetical protein
MEEGKYSVLYMAQVESLLNDRDECLSRVHSV